MKTLTIEIEAIRLRTCFMARPKGAMGNVGWVPFPWTGQYGKTSQQAIARFEKEHKQKLEKFQIKK